MAHASGAQQIYITLTPKSDSAYVGSSPAASNIGTARATGGTDATIIKTSSQGAIPIIGRFTSTANTYYNVNLVVHEGDASKTYTIHFVP